MNVILWRARQVETERILRALSSEIGATPIYISTDYVFDGTKTKPYTEKDQPNPINTYGISKLAGELYTKQTSTHYIIRISSLFGTAGANGKGGKRARNSKPQRKNRIKCGVRSK